MALYHGWHNAAMAMPNTNAPLTMFHQLLLTIASSNKCSKEMFSANAKHNCLAQMSAQCLAQMLSTTGSKEVAKEQQELSPRPWHKDRCICNAFLQCLRAMPCPSSNSHPPAILSHFYLAFTACSYLICFIKIACPCNLHYILQCICIFLIQMMCNTMLNNKYCPIH